MLTLISSLDTTQKVVCGIVLLGIVVLLIYLIRRKPEKYELPRTFGEDKESS